MIFLYLVLILSAAGLNLKDSFQLPDGVDDPDRMDVNNVYVQNGTTSYTAYDFSGTRRAVFVPADSEFKFIPDEYYWYRNSTSIYMNMVTEDGEAATTDPQEVGEGILLYDWSQQAHGVFTSESDGNMYFYTAYGRRVWTAGCPVDLLYSTAFGQSAIIYYKTSIVDKTVQMKKCSNGNTTEIDAPIDLDERPISGVYMLFSNDDSGWAYYKTLDAIQVFEFTGYAKKGDEITVAYPSSGEYSFLLDGDDLLVEYVEDQRLSFNSLEANGTIVPIWEKEGETSSVRIDYRDLLVRKVGDTFYVFEVGTGSLLFWIMIGTFAIIVAGVIIFWAI